MSKSISIFQPFLKQPSNQPALVTPFRIYTWKDMHMLVNRTADKLCQLGFNENDRVAFCLPASTEAVILLTSLICGKYTASPINPLFPAKAVVEMLKIINSRAVITTADRFDGFHEAGITCLDINSVVDLDTKSNKHDIHLPESLPLDQPATIIFSSGSSSQPKAVIHTLGNHCFSALGSNENIQLNQGDRWLLSLPLFHTAGIGILFRCLLSGASIVVPGIGEKLADSIIKYNITHLSLVATRLQRLLRSNLAVMQSSLKAVLLGGSAIPHHLVQSAYSKGLKLFLSYGSTEMASQITTSRPGESLDNLKTSGKVLKYRELKISEDGEILVKGDTLALGYIQSGSISPIRDSEGWFHTGDRGCLDEDGYLTVAGRIDNMFISGGENIYPEEIESAILQIPGIDDAIVVPVNDPEFGQRPAAFIKMLDGFIEKDLLDGLKLKLPRFKHPVAVYPWPEMENVQGIKPDRKYLKSLAQSLKKNETI